MNRNLESYLEKYQKEFGRRLRLERIRLGHDIGTFAEMLDIHRNTQTKYEKGTRSPSDDYLKKVEKIGVDMLYLNSDIRINDFAFVMHSITKDIFDRSNVKVNPNAIEKLFTLFAMDQFYAVRSNNLSDDFKDKLVKLAFENGDVFVEAYEASSYFLINNNLYIEHKCNLIIEVTEVYMKVKDDFSGLTLTDAIKLITEGISNKYETRYVSIKHK